MIFNLCFNIFICYTSDQTFNDFGFKIRFLGPVPWFQFADGAAVITGLETENQFQLNHFTRWCTWLNMIIRLYLWNKKTSTSIQYLLKLIINTVAIGRSFKYLGRYFSCSVDNADHMPEVLDMVNGLLGKTDKTPVTQSILLHASNKTRCLIICLKTFLISLWNI